MVGPSQLAGQASLDELARKSDAVIVAIVESKAWVVRPEKMLAEQKQLPNGSVEVGIPNPRDFVVGSLFNVRIEQILKEHNGVRRGRTVRIFVPGFMASAHEVAAILLGEKYLLFLEALDPEGGKFVGTKVHRPEANVTNVEDFDPKSSFAVIEAGNGAVQITKKNLELVERVKASLKP